MTQEKPETHAITDADVAGELAADMGADAMLEATDAAAVLARVHGELQQAVRAQEHYRIARLVAEARNALGGIAVWNEIAADARGVSTERKAEIEPCPDTERAG